MTIYSFINQSAFQLSTILVVVSCLIYTLTQRHTDRPQNAVFMVSTISLAVTAICELVYYYQLPHATDGQTARFAVHAANYLYYAIHGLLSMMLFYYALFATKVFQRARLIHHVFYLLPCLTGEFLILFNPVLKLIWSFDEHMNYYRGSAIGVLYVISAFYYVLSIRLFLLKWSGSTKIRRIIIFYSMFISVAGIVIQMLLEGIETELFFESIAFMGLMLAFEYDEDRLDTATGVYNRIALMQDTRNYIENNRKFYAICVRITNLETLQRVLGASDNEEIFRLVANYLIDVHHRYMIYRPTPTTFLLLNLRGNEGQVRFLSQMISWKLEEGWEYQGRSLPLHGVILYASAPDELHSPEDILLMCETPLPSSENG
nr:hypothetical protein [Lachnospiraceae bacterium]